MFLLLASCVTPPSAESAAPEVSVRRADVAEGDTAGFDPPQLTLLPDENLATPIVIGAGAAGLAVAMDLGGALVLEAEPEIGGRARWAGGFLFMVGTEEQAAAGVEDSPAQAAADWPELTGSEATDATLAFLEASDAVRDRLVDIGVHLTLPVERVDPRLHRRRQHSPEGGGPALVAALAAQLPATVEVRLDTHVRGLVILDGVAAGVWTDAGWIRSDTVVVASGGFVDRADLLALDAGWEEGTWRLGDVTLASGSALDYAAAAGLGTAALDAIGSYSDVIGIPGADGNAMRVASGPVRPWIWVDDSGERFADESATWSLVLASQARSRGNVWALTTREVLVTKLLAEDLPYLVESDGWRCAEDWDELAETIGVNTDAVLLTVEEAIRLQAGGAGDLFGRPPSTFPSMVGEPCAFRPGHIGAKNFGGLAVDADGRVFDTGGNVVPGLWAVGEAAGMGVPGLGGQSGFDGSLAAVIWSGWRTGAAIASE